MTAISEDQKWQSDCDASDPEVEASVREGGADGGVVVDISGREYCDVFLEMVSLPIITWGPSKPPAIGTASAADVLPNTLAARQVPSTTTVAWQPPRPICTLSAGAVDPEAPPKPWPATRQRVSATEFCILLPDLETTYFEDQYISRGIPVSLANDDGFLRSFCMGDYLPEGSVAFPIGAVTSAHVSTEQKMNGVTYIKMVGTLDCGRLGNLNCGYGPVPYDQCGKEPYSGPDPAIHANATQYLQMMSGLAFSLHICVGGAAVDGEPCYNPGSFGAMIFSRYYPQSLPGFSTDDVKVKVDLPSPSGSEAGACDMQFVATTASGDPTSSSSGSTSRTSSSVALPISMSLVAAFLAVALVALLLWIRRIRTVVRANQESFYIVNDPLGSARLKATPADASVAGDTIGSQSAGIDGEAVFVANDVAEAKMGTAGRLWTTVTEPPVAVGSSREWVDALELDIIKDAGTKPDLVADSLPELGKKASKEGPSRVGIAETMRNTGASTSRDTTMEVGGSSAKSSLSLPSIPTGVTSAAGSVIVLPFSTTKKSPLSAAHWSVDDVSSWLWERGLSAAMIRNFRENEVDGPALLALTDETMRMRLGMTSQTARDVLRMAISKLRAGRVISGFQSPSDIASEGLAPPPYQPGTES
ncbi:hypothetical protein HK101_000574 [Irineochytrium annulatum]|nr:hypothetical protein HK101_000574 [Irineochytrium annulatum]